MISPARYGYSNIKELKETIIQWYINEELTQNDIAERLGCQRQTVISIFKTLNIQTINNNKLHIKCKFANEEQMIDEFKRLYHEKQQSKKQIATIYKINPVSISILFKKYNIKSRTSSEYLSLTYNDINPTEKEMEIINGLLLGNGHIKENKYTAQLKINLKHEEIINDLIKLLNNIKITIYYKNGYILATKSYPFFKTLKLENVNLTPETCYWWYINTGSVKNGYTKLKTKSPNIISLSQKLPIKTTIWQIHNNDTIIINKTEDRQKFLRYIGPCRHQCYAYKWRVLNNNGEDSGY